MTVTSLAQNSAEELIKARAALPVSAQLHHLGRAIKKATSCSGLLSG